MNGMSFPSYLFRPSRAFRAVAGGEKVSSSPRQQALTELDPMTAIGLLLPFRGSIRKRAAARKINRASAASLAFCMRKRHNASMAISITIRNIPEKARDELAARAAASGRSLQEYLRAQLIDLASRPDLDTVLARIAERKQRTATELSARQNPRAPRRRPPLERAFDGIKCAL